MSPIKLLALFAALILLAITCTWYLTEPKCPNVAGYRQQHPGVQCR